MYCVHIHNLYETVHKLECSDLFMLLTCLCSVVVYSIFIFVFCIPIIAVCFINPYQSIAAAIRIVALHCI